MRRFGAAASSGADSITGITGLTSPAGARTPVRYGHNPVMHRPMPLSRLLRLAAVIAVVLVVGACAGPAATAVATLDAAGSSPAASSSGGFARPTAAPVDSGTPLLPTQTASTPPSAPSTTAAPPTSSSSSSTEAAPTTLADLVAQLPVAPGHRAGYSRTLFRLWIDADGNGCNTRREVLIAEAVVAPKVGSGCRLTGGKWISPYDGITTTNSSTFDIDHVVPLAEAWDSGAWAWTPARRQSYANDLAVPWALIAVSAASNRSKGDEDPAEWLPPLPTARCTYAVGWVAVKIRWQLSVDPAEQQALGQLASECASTPVPPIPLQPAP